MKYPMRRKDRQMSEEFAYEIADKCVFASLATVNEDGSPYCIPVNIARNGRRLYFHSAKAGQKIENLRRNNAVCLCCVGDTNVPDGRFTMDFESAVIYGHARELTAEAEKVEALRLICMRHAPGNMDDFSNAMERSLERTSVWTIEIDEITGKRKKYDSEGTEMTWGRME